MRDFLSPTRQKCKIAGLALLLCCCTFLLRLLPVSIDILNLRDIPGYLLTVLGKWPLSIFDLITNDAFRPQGGGFLVFPTATQVIFLVFFNLIFFYLVGCVWDKIRGDGN